MQSTGDGVTAAAELTAGVQDRQHDLDRRLLLHRVDVDRDAAAVVDDTHSAIGQQRDIDGVAVPGEGLIHRVIDDLVDEVVKTTGTRGSDIHTGTLAYGL